MQQQVSTNSQSTGLNTETDETGDTGLIAEELIDGLNRSKGWVLFIAVISSVMAVLHMISILLSDSTKDIVASIAYFNVYVVSLVLLFKYHSAINRLLGSRSVTDFIAALDIQRRYFIAGTCLMLVYTVSTLLSFWDVHLLLSRENQIL